MPEEVIEHIDGLDEVFADGAIGDGGCDTGGEARHAGEGAGEHGEEVVGDHVGEAVAFHLSGGVILEDGDPEEDLGDDGEEADEGGEGEVGAVGESFVDGGAEHEPFESEPGVDFVGECVCGVCHQG